MTMLNQDQLNTIALAVARALIVQMREALMMADDEKGGSINSRMAVVDALTAADAWLKANGGE